MKKTTYWVLHMFNIYFQKQTSGQTYVFISTLFYSLFLVLKGKVYRKFEENGNSGSPKQASSSVLLNSLSKSSKTVQLNVSCSCRARTSEPCPPLCPLSSLPQQEQQDCTAQCLLLMQSQDLRTMSSSLSPSARVARQQLNVSCSYRARTSEPCPPLCLPQQEQQDCTA